MTPRRLTAAQALRITLERQGLVRRVTERDPAAAVERFGPLHATDHRTPYLSLLARVEDFSIAALDRAWLVERRLDRRSAMRGTFHLVPLAHVADVICACGAPRPEEQRFVRQAGISPSQAERLRAAVEAALRVQGPLEIAGLKRSLPADLRAEMAAKTLLGTSVLALVLRWMAEAGFLVTSAKLDPRAASSPSGWGRSPRTYALYESVFGPRPQCVREEADARLARWYFDAHGPAALEDWAWWSGLPAPRSRAAFDALGGDLEPVEVEGWPFMYLPRGTMDAGKPRTAGPTVRLLPYEDAAIKAYRSTRPRFFDPLVEERSHTLYGEVLPTILLDGRVVGTWSSGAGGWSGALEAAAGRPARELAAELFVPVDRAAKAALEVELARVQAAIDAAAPADPRVDAPAGGG